MTCGVNGDDASISGCPTNIESGATNPAGDMVVTTDWVGYSDGWVKVNDPTDATKFCTFNFEYAVDTTSSYQWYNSLKAKGAGNWSCCFLKSAGQFCVGDAQSCLKNGNAGFTCQ